MFKLRQESTQRMSHNRKWHAKAGDGGGCSERILFNVLQLRACDVLQRL